MYWHKKHICWLLLLLLCSSLAAVAQGGTGLIFDDAAYAAQQRISPSLKFSGTELPVYSLRKYCPVAGNQGLIGSCVGWAAGYATYTISLAIRDNITDRAAIVQMAKSALYIYNQIKIGPCEKGSYLQDAVILLKDQGVCNFRDFNPPGCQVLPTAVQQSLASTNKIADFYTLFEYDALPDNKVAATIRSLSANKPVLFGMKITSSFSSNHIDKTGLWNPTPSDSDKGGHAMCVVGYDNINRRFEILNSWGPAFGDNGFAYVSYEDYGRRCEYAYNISLPPAPAVASSLQGGFFLNRLAGFSPGGDYVFEKLSGRWNGRYYELGPGVVHLRDYFKVMAANLQADTYLYIFSLKPDGSSELLFPTASSSSGRPVQDAAVIASGDNYVEIPADPSGAFLADLPGVDHLVCLFSRQRLDDIDALVRQVETGRGEVFDRLQTALGNRSVPAADIRYEGAAMRFSSTTRSAGFVVPMVLKVSVN
jgi:hypothetical protein